MKPLASENAWMVLHILSKASAPMTSLEITERKFIIPPSNRKSSSASAANLALELVRRGYAERKMHHCGLYQYSITDAGRKALAERESKP